MIKTYAIVIGILILGAVVSFVLAGDLPDVVASRWDFQNRPVGAMPLSWILYGMPLYGLCLIGFIEICVRFTPKPWNMDRSRQALAGIHVIIAVIIALAQVGVVLINRYPESFDASHLVAAVFVIALIGLGNYMGKLERNRIAGIRTPWSLASEENWFHTHRFAAKAMVGGGLLLLGVSFFTTHGLVLAGVFLSAIFLPFFYSYFYSRRERASRGG